MSTGVQISSLQVVDAEHLDILKNLFLSQKLRARTIVPFCLLDVVEAEASNLTPSPVFVRKRTVLLKRHRGAEDAEIG